MQPVDRGYRRVMGWLNSVRTSFCCGLLDELAYRWRWVRNALGEARQPRRQEGIFRFPTFVCQYRDTGYAQPSESQAARANVQPDAPVRALLSIK